MNAETIRKEEEDEEDEKQRKSKPYLTLSLLVASGTGFSHRDVVDLCYYMRL